MSTYDSRPDTQAHIARVRALMYGAIENLTQRALEHDRSKLVEPELSVFNEWTPKLAELHYGSDEYREALLAMKPALDHHYQYNRHHPEHRHNGVNGMSLLDALEMVCDWKAASERHAVRTDFRRSLEVNTERFDLDPMVADLFLNTAVELGWI